MGEKLGFLREGETASMDEYSQRVRALPGRGRFRTGVSLRSSFKELSESPKSSSPVDKFLFSVSFPYFGGPSEGFSWDPGGESVRLLDFKHQGVDAPDLKTVVSGERDNRRGDNDREGGDIGASGTIYDI